MGILMPLVNQAATTLVVLACSATKLDHAAPAIDLYRGVMYSTFRANAQPSREPAVMILSALLGFINPDSFIEPYDQLMTPARADAMLVELDRFMPTAWPGSARRILFARGAELPAGDESGIRAPGRARDPAARCGRPGDDRQHRVSTAAARRIPPKRSFLGSPSCDRSSAW